MATRVYRIDPVKRLDSDPLKFTDPKTRLIRANTPAAAIAFATKNLYAVKVAGPEEMFELGKSGVEIETATVGE